MLNQVAQGESLSNFRKGSKVGFDDRVGQLRLVEVYIVFQCLALATASSRPGRELALSFSARFASCRVEAEELKGKRVDFRNESSSDKIEGP